MAVSTEDHVQISQHLARYCWTVDELDSKGWADLFTEDGVFAGALAQDVHGRTALCRVPIDAGELIPAMRHFITNLHCDYQHDRDTVTARYYTCITSWKNGGQFYALALASAQLVRSGDGWLISRSDNVMLPRV
jgi:hypothetical protein